MPVDSCGGIDPADTLRALKPRTILVSIIHTNNEVGTIQPIEECARIARERGILFHTDAAQSARKIATNSARSCAGRLSPPQWRRIGSRSFFEIEECNSKGHPQPIGAFSTEEIAVDHVPVFRLRAAGLSSSITG